MNHIKPPQIDHEDRKEPKTPMRQFNYDPPEAPSLLRRRLEILWYAVMPIVVIAAISTLGIWAGIQYYQSGEGEAAESRPSGQNQRPIDAGEFQASFLKSYIEEKSSNGENSKGDLRVLGTYSGSDGIQVFKGVLDLNGNATLQLEFDDTLEMEFIDGKLVSSVSPLYQMDAAIMADLVDALRDPLLTLNENKTSSPIKLSPAQFMGVEAYEIELEQDPSGTKETLLISTSSLTILERRKESMTGAVHKYHYADYKIAPGGRLPHTISIQDPFGYRNRISITQIRRESESNTKLANF